MDTTNGALNRKLRMALVGGGAGAFIGRVHATAAVLDNRAELVAGALSSNPEKAKSSAPSYDIKPDRAYGSYQELIEKELKLPEDQRIIVHNDFYHYKLPVYREVVDQLDTSTCLSFLVLLQAPEAGGEVVMHALTAADPTPRLPGGLPDGDTIRARYRAEHLKMAAGDLLLFAAGRLYHHVSPVVGATPRITLGGFLTLDRDHARVTYWN